MDRADTAIGWPEIRGRLKRCRLVRVQAAGQRKHALRETVDHPGVTDRKALADCSAPVGIQVPDPPAYAGGFSWKRPIQARSVSDGIPRLANSTSSVSGVHSIRSRASRPIRRAACSAARRGRGTLPWRNVDRYRCGISGGSRSSCYAGAEGSAKARSRGAAAAPGRPRRLWLSAGTRAVGCDQKAECRLFAQSLQVDRVVCVCILLRCCR